MSRRNILIILFILFFWSCNNNNSKIKSNKVERIIIKKDSANEFNAIKTDKKDLADTSDIQFKDSDLLNITLFSDQFVIKMRYATKDNFLDTVLYPCAKCLLRFEVIKDLMKAESEFEEKGFYIKIYDCYRPFDVQKLMWEKLPVRGLVADPYNGGSRHNRGTAVDVSLVDSAGKELDFGTPHDDFSKKAKTFFQNLPDTVKANRMYLREVMQKHHFKGINSEWWHFSHNCGTKYKVSNRKFNCDSLKN